MSFFPQFKLYKGTRTLLVFKKGKNIIFQNTNHLHALLKSFKITVKSSAKPIYIPKNGYACIRKWITLKAFFFFFFFFYCIKLLNDSSRKIFFVSNRIRNVPGTNELVSKIYTKGIHQAWDIKQFRKFLLSQQINDENVIWFVTWHRRFHRRRFFFSFFLFP